MIYKTAWINPKGNHLLKIDFEDGKGDVWVNTSEVVYNFAKKMLHGKDSVELKYTEKEGEKTIERITKFQGEGGKDVGGKKDEKKDSTYSGTTKFDSELSKRQTCMNATASIMQSLVGRVNENNVTGLMETVYQKAFELINT